jgi:hypothetical protein
MSDETKKELLRLKNQIEDLQTKYDEYSDKLDEELSEVVYAIEDELGKK